MLPTLRISFMEITPQMMEKNTIGTTMNLIRFRKIVPNGFMYFTAISGAPIKHKPAMIPRARPIKI